MDRDQALRQQLVQLIRGGNAHVKADEALDGIPIALRGTRPQGSPYSPWELLEHLRIAQWDILEFSRDAKHKSPKWPEGYWPKSAEPSTFGAWEESVAGFRSDMDAMCALVEDIHTDLHASIPGGDGQTLLREALLVADHNAYHVGQLVLVRRLLGEWNPE